MRITLVTPQSYRPNVVLAQLEKNTLNPPVGLLYLAAGLAPHHDVRIVDAQLRRLPVDMLADEILSGNPDLVGVSVNFTTLIRNAQVLGKSLKAARPDLLVVAGGNCATFLSRSLCESGAFDAVFLHEADRSFPAFVSALERGDAWSTPGITYFRNGQIRVNTFAEYVQNLDTLPMPRYDLLPERDRYLATIVSSRGCSFNCIYCSTKSMWRRWRSRTPESVLREIDALYALGYRSTLAFCDDEFMASRPRALSIARMLIDRGYKYQWGIAGRIELVNDELLDTLSNAGCQQIFFGIESGSDRVRKVLKRPLTADEVERTVDRCYQFGILPIVSFMVGIPFETREDALQTLALMRRINTYKVQLSVFTPFLGTPVYQHPAAFGVRLDPAAHDYANASIDVGTVVHSTEHLTAEEIRDLWYEGQGIILKRYQESEQYERVKEQIRASRGKSEQAPLKDERKVDCGCGEVQFPVSAC